VTVQATLELDHPIAECGGAVLGTVEWSGNRRRHPVGVVLRFRTQGRGDTDAEAVVACAVGTEEAGRARFRLDVPVTGPVTYHGHLLRLTWHVTVHVPVTTTSWRPGSSPAADVTVLPWGWSRLPARPPDG
jgi:hypothetical protein